jgi:hypothetical protein
LKQCYRQIFHSAWDFFLFFVQGPSRIAPTYVALVRLRRGASSSADRQWWLPASKQTGEAKLKIDILITRAVTWRDTALFDKCALVDDGISRFIPPSKGPKNFDSYNCQSCNQISPKKKAQPSTSQSASLNYYYFFFHFIKMVVLFVLKTYCCRDKIPCCIGTRT